MSKIAAAFLFGIVLTWIAIYMYGLQQMHEWRKKLKEGDRVLVANGKNESYEAVIYHFNSNGTALVRGPHYINQVKLKHLWKVKS